MHGLPAAAAPHAALGAADESSAARQVAAPRPAAAVVAAFALNGSPWAGLAALGVMVASVVAFELASRRGLPIAAQLTGVGDERERSLYLQANARTGELMAYVIAIWGTWSVAEGKDNKTLLGIAGIYGALWVFNIGRTLLADRRTQVDPV